MSVELNPSGISREQVPSAGVLFDAMVGAGKLSLAANELEAQKEYFKDAVELAIGVRIAPEDQQSEVEKRLQLMAMPYRLGEPAPLDPIGLQVVDRIFPIADSIIAQNQANRLYRKYNLNGI